MASPALNGSYGINGSSGTLIVGAGGLLGAKADDILIDESSWSCCGCAGPETGNEAEREKFIDPGLRKDFLAWKKDPSFERGTSEFLERLYREDIDLCLVSQLHKLSRLAQFIGIFLLFEYFPLGHEMPLLGNII